MATPYKRYLILQIWDPLDGLVSETPTAHTKLRSFRYHYPIISILSEKRNVLELP